MPGTIGSLVADSAETTGLKWAAPSSGLTLIKRATSTSVADTGTTFDGVFSASYNNYLIAIESWSNSAGAGPDPYIQLRYAGPTTQAGTYYWNNFTNISNGTTASAYANPSNYWQIARNTGGGRPGSGNFWISRVNGGYPLMYGTYGEDDTEEICTFIGLQHTTRTYTGLIFSSSSGNLTLTASIYGLAL